MDHAWISPELNLKNSYQWVSVEERANLICLQRYRYPEAHPQQCYAREQAYDRTQSERIAFRVFYRIAIASATSPEAYTVFASTTEAASREAWQWIMDEPRINWSELLQLDRDHQKQYLLGMFESLAIDKAKRLFRLHHLNSESYQLTFRKSAEQFSRHFPTHDAKRILVHLALRDHAKAKTPACIVFLSDRALFLIVKDSAPRVIHYHSIKSVGAMCMLQVSSNYALHVRYASGNNIEHVQLEDYSKLVCKRLSYTLRYLWHEYHETLLLESTVASSSSSYSQQVYIPRQHRVLAQQSLHDRIYLLALNEREKRVLKIYQICKRTNKSNSKTQRAGLLPEAVFQGTLASSKGKCVFNLPEMGNVMLSCFEGGILVLESASLTSQVSIMVMRRARLLPSGALASLCNVKFSIPKAIRRDTRLIKLRAPETPRYCFRVNERVYVHLDVFREVDVPKETNRTELWRKAVPTCYFLKPRKARLDQAPCGCIVFRNAQLRDLVYSEGVPHHMQAYLWLCWSSKTDQIVFPPPFFDRAREIAPELAAEIEKDIPRTFPNHPSLANRESAAALVRLLTAYGIRNPSIGYAQGMNFLACTLFMICDGDEHSIFALLATLCEDILAGYYCAPDVVGLYIDADVVLSMINEHAPQIPRLLARISDMEHVQLQCFQWLPKMFIGTLAFHEVLRVLDIVFYEHSHLILLKLCYAMLVSLESAIAECTSDADFYEMLERNTPSLDQLLSYCESEEMLWCTAKDYRARRREQIQKHIRINVKRDHIPLVYASASDSIAKHYHSYAINVRVRKTHDTAFPPGEDILWQRL